MKTLFIGQNAIHLKAVGSTNTYASELLQQLKPVEGTLIYTFNQQSGRGQRGNVWESEPNKNAAFSFILYPSIVLAEQQFILTKITSLAVADLMADLLRASAKSPEIKIKWPNDVYVGSKKIAGILIENTLREKHIQHCIIGIGININQLTFSEGLNASSLALFTGIEFDLNDVIEKLCEKLEARYLQLRANKKDLIDAEYLARLYQKDEWRRYRSNNQEFDGKITGVAINGKLHIALHSGGVKEFDLKEIQFV